jgi:Flp pilus assembly protein TadG
MVTLETRKSGRNKGTTTIEAAFIFPLLLMLTFGVIHYGWLFMRVNQITNAARQGVRVAICPGATVQNVTDAVNNVMSKAGISTGDYDMSTPTGIDVSVGAPVTVQVENVPIAKISLVNIPFMPASTGNLKPISVTMAKEGPS